MAIQARIPPALAAVHNFIRIHDPEEIQDFNFLAEDPLRGYGDLGVGPANEEERAEAASMRDNIAQAMWDGYQAELASRMEHGIQ